MLFRAAQVYAFGRTAPVGTRAPAGDGPLDLAEFTKKSMGERPLTREEMRYIHTMIRKVMDRTEAVFDGLDDPMPDGGIHQFFRVVAADRPDRKGFKVTYADWLEPDTFMEQLPPELPELEGDLADIDFDGLMPWIEGEAT